MNPRFDRYDRRIPEDRRRFDDRRSLPRRPRSDSPRRFRQRQAWDVPPPSDKPRRFGMKVMEEDRQVAGRNPPLIISCSRRTDVPWGFLRQYLNGFEDGFMYIASGPRKNPIVRAVKWIAAWQKPDSVLHRYPVHLFNYTINSENLALEPGVDTSLTERLGQLTFLVQTFGAHAVSPRFDPIVHYRNIVGGPIMDNTKDFEVVVRHIGSLGVDHVVFSFCQAYPKSVATCAAALQSEELSFDPGLQPALEFMCCMGRTTGEVFRQILSELPSLLAQEFKRGLPAAVEKVLRHMQFHAASPKVAVVILNVLHRLNEPSAEKFRSCFSDLLKDLEEKAWGTPLRAPEGDSGTASWDETHGRPVSVGAEPFLATLRRSCLMYALEHQLLKQTVVGTWELSVAKAAPRISFPSVPEPAAGPSIMGGLSSCEKCVGPAAAGPDEKLRRESTNIMAGPPPRRPDPDAIASPVIVTVADLFGRLEELHQAHFQRSKQLLQEIKAHRETEAKAASLKSSDYTGRIDAEQHCLEEDRSLELQSHLSWGRDVLSGIRAPLSAQSGAMETAPVANEVEAVTIRMSEARQSPTNMSSMEDSAEVAPMPKGGSTPRPRRQSTVAPKGLAALMKRPVVRWTLYVCLAIALFGPGMVTLLDLPDEPTVIIMDILMFIIAVAFTLEMLGLLMVDELYRYSFFFAMDLLGTLSMAFEISFLLGQLVNSNTVVLRTARTAKLGARIGRLIKLVKCVSMFYRSSGKKSSQVEAKVLASKLVVLLSTRVSVIVILMVMVVPLSTLPLHPTEDLSLSLWPNKLEESYFQDQRLAASCTQELLGQLLVSCFSKEVTLENCLVQRVCNAAVLFDFTSPAQLDALVEVVTIAFIIGLMALTSCDLQQVVDANLVKPLEGMLQHVRENAAHIFERFSKQTQAADLDSEENEDTGASEIELIQLILKKLARLATLAEVSTHAVTQNELENLGLDQSPAVRLRPQRHRVG
eukprot:g29554.t1